MFKTILLAYDGSAHADRALTAAAEMTRAFGAALHVISIPEPDMPALILAPYGTVVNVPPSDAEVAAAGAKIIGQAHVHLAELSVELADSHVRRGDPVASILLLADATDADMIIMGRRGLGPLKALALGSVSQSVAQQSRGAVLTVA